MLDAGELHRKKGMMNEKDFNQDA